MSYLKALAADLDGTLTDGRSVPKEILAALSAARVDNVRSLLVTGRTRTDLEQAFPGLSAAFDAVVAENGAVLFTRHGARLLAAPVEESLRAALTDRGIRVDAGDVLLACDGAHTAAVTEEIGRLGLDSQLVHNRAALMVLPSGVSKGTGLRAALAELGLSPHNTLALGDAENDLALLRAAEIGVAVANAVPSLKAHADLVLQAPGAEGITDLLNGPLFNGTEPLCPPRRWVRIGTFDDGSPATVPGSQANILVTGPSGKGKSYVAGLLAEGWAAAGYRILVIDPEGDHGGLGQLPGMRLLGGNHSLPAPVELINDLLVSSAVIDLSALAAAEKTRYARQLLEAADLLRAEYGLPHWVVIDEAHLLVPDPDFAGQLQRLAGRGEALVTFQSEALPERVTALIDVTISVTESTPDPATRFAPAPRATLTLEGRQRSFTAAVRHTSHTRHLRKYVNADLAPHQRFYFRAGEGTEAVAGAANLTEFVRQLAAAGRSTVDYHLTRGDFSSWVNGTLQDIRLGRQIAVIEHDARAAHALTVEHARRRLMDAISARYFVNPLPERIRLVDLTDEARPRDAAPAEVEEPPA